MNRNVSHRFYPFLAVLLLSAFALQAQSYNSAAPRAIQGAMQTTYDTINVSSLPQNINGTFGLDSLTLNMTYGNPGDLSIFLISPDGKQVSICENIGGAPDMTGTCITHWTTTLMKNLYAPFTGKMRPEGWLGTVNDGQAGLGNWVLKIENTTNNTGTLLNWGLYFDNTPAPPAFFDSSRLAIMVVNTNNVVIPYYNDNKGTARKG